MGKDSAVAPRLKEAVAAGLTQPQRKASMQLPGSLRPVQLQSPPSPLLLYPAAASSSYGNGSLGREASNGDTEHYSAASNGHSGSCLRCAGDQQCRCGTRSASSPPPAMKGHSSSADKQPACRAASCHDEACDAGILINGVNGALTWL